MSLPMPVINDSSRHIIGESALYKSIIEVMFINHDLRK